MKFKKEIQKLFTRAGWYKGRKIDIKKLNLPYNDYPPFIVEFLREYGNLSIGRVPHESLKGAAFLELFPEMDANMLKGDNTYPYYQSLLDKKLYPLGGYFPDGYNICCDDDGRVYQIGEYCFHVGINLFNGIENILLTNSLNYFQLDEDSRKWWNMDGSYEDLP